MKLESSIQHLWSIVESSEGMMKQLMVLEKSSVCRCCSRLTRVSIASHDLADAVYIMGRKKKIDKKI